MAKVTIEVEDTEDGNITSRYYMEPAFPENADNFTTAQIIGATFIDLIKTSFSHTATTTVYDNEGKVIYHDPT